MHFLDRPDRLSLHCDMLCCETAYTSRYQQAVCSFRSSSSHYVLNCLLTAEKGLGKKPLFDARQLPLILDGQCAVKADLLVISIYF